MRLYVASPEDVIIAKMEWAKRGVRISAIVNSYFGIVNARFGHRERSEAKPGIQASS